MQNSIDDIFKNLGEIELNINVSWKNKNILHLDYSIIKNGVYNLKNLNPKYNFVINDNNDIETYLYNNLTALDYELIKNKHIVEKTDLWRLIKIYNEGGIYMDIDRLCNMPLSKIIKPGIKCILPIYCHGGYLLDFSQDIIISCSKNPILKKAIELNLERRRNGVNDICFLGPNTYLHTISKFLIGKQVNRIFGNNKERDESFKTMQHIINNSQYIDTYIEKPLYNTIMYKGEHVLFDKMVFYADQTVKHHNT